MKWPKHFLGFTIYSWHGGMHGGIERRLRDGWLVFIPYDYDYRPLYWSWRLYFSPDGTPTEATWGVGPAYRRPAKARQRIWSAPSAGGRYA